MNELSGIGTTCSRVKALDRHLNDGQTLQQVERVLTKKSRLICDASILYISRQATK